MVAGGSVVHLSSAEDTPCSHEMQAKETLRTHDEVNNHEFSTSIYFEIIFHINYKWFS